MIGSVAKVPRTLSRDSDKFEEFKESAVVVVIVLDVCAEALYPQYVTRAWMTVSLTDVTKAEARGSGSCGEPLEAEEGVETRKREDDSARRLGVIPEEVSILMSSVISTVSTAGEDEEEAEEEDASPGVDDVFPKPKKVFYNDNEDAEYIFSVFSLNFLGSLLLLLPGCCETSFGISETPAASQASSFTLQTFSLSTSPSLLQ